MASAPAIWNIVVTDTGGVLLKFTAGVLVQKATIASLIEVRDTAGVVCPYIPAATRDGFLTGVQVQCDKRAWTDKRIHLSLKPGLFSATNVPLGVLNRGATKSEDVVQIRTVDEDLDFATASPCDETKRCAVFSP